MRNCAMYLFWFVHQLTSSSGVYAPPSLSQGYLSSVCTEMKIKAFTQQCQLVLSGPSVPLINATSHHSTDSRCCSWFCCCFCTTFTPVGTVIGFFFFFLVLYVNMCEENPSLPGGWLFRLFYAWNHLPDDPTSGRSAWIFPSDFSAYPSTWPSSCHGDKIGMCKSACQHDRTSGWSCEAQIDGCRLWVLAQTNQPLGHI